MADIEISGRNVSRIRDMGARVSSTMDSLNATSKRIEETAGWVTVALACVAVVSIAALGLAVIALIGNSHKKAASDD
jgi:hypothetical protein